jgi:nucleoside-diphosphate-sugar epimerase
VKDSSKKKKIVITGAAGLVGQNLVTLLVKHEDYELVALDRHRHNLGLLERLHPSVRTVEADLAESGEWEAVFAGCDVVVQLHAQVTAQNWEPFERNNLVATERVLRVMKAAGVPYLVHVSSSVVVSVADDNYTRSKKAQEALVRESGVPHCILRPTLMYGWFDPKHLGWLARFMNKVPVFPIPGDGRYMRQPLYALDFSRVIEVCIERQPTGEVYDLVGVERIDYVDILRAIRRIQRLRTPFLHIPVPIFKALLRIYALGSKKPPFTADQLTALSAGDDFSGVDLFETFGIRPTPFEQGMSETLTHPEYASVVLQSTAEK